MNAIERDRWVRKAEVDYRAALGLDASDVPEAICFHCQQCIEKYLKATLVAHGQRPPWVHDLIALGDAVAKLDASFAALGDQLDVLTPYAVDTRYPGTEASPDDAREAVQIMEELRSRIRLFLALDVD